MFFETNAQCAMCRAVLESEEGQSTAEGVNDYVFDVDTLFAAHRFGNYHLFQILSKTSLRIFSLFL